MRIEGVARDVIYDPINDSFSEPSPTPYSQASPQGYSDYGSLGQYLVRVAKPIDASLPTLSITANGSLIAEGGTASFSIATSDGSNPTVDIGFSSVRQSAPGDIAQPTADLSDVTFTSQSVSLSGGQAVVDVPILIDGNVEPNEFFEIVIVSSIAGYEIAQQSAAVQIEEVERQYSVTIDNNQIVEGDPGDTNTVPLTLTRVGNTTPADSIDWQLVSDASTQTDASDFSISSGSVTFASGQKTAALNVPIEGDLDIEGNEQFKIEISAPAGSDVLIDPAVSSVTGTIIDDESIIDISSGVRFRFRQLASSGNNFDNWAIDNVVISGTGFADDFDPDFDTALWSDISGGEARNLFPGSSGNALFMGVSSSTRIAETIDVAPPTNSTISFDLIFANANGSGLNATEQGEDVALEFSLDGGSQWETLNVYDEDEITTWTSFSETLPAQATLPPTEFLEGDNGGITNAVIPLTRLGYRDKAATANWVVLPGAIDPVDADDFDDGALPSGTLTFSAGQAVADIIIPIKADDVVEPIENFLVQITSFDGGPILSDTIEGSILSDDLATASINVLDAGGSPLIDGETSTSVESGTNFEVVWMDGLDSQTRTFTIENTGVLPLNLSSIEISGTASADFTISNLSSTNVPVGQNVTFDVTFQPTSDGVRDATVEITSSDADNSVFEFAVTGTGTDLWVEEVLINDGSATRSQITSISVYFNKDVSSSQLFDAFRIHHMETQAVIEGFDLAVTPMTDGGRSLVRISFANDNHPLVLSRIGDALEGNSLVDGNYRLEILRGNLFAFGDRGGTLYMDYDPEFGGQFYGDDNNDDFFRLYGDLNGDGVLNTIDINIAVNTLQGGPYRWDMDYNGDGVINTIEINALRPTVFGPGRN
ncbi:MAG: choice-of-anchor D domain-containing protein [Planctomycetota bacterium]